MLIHKWNIDEAKEAWFDEGIEQGRAEEREYLLELLEQGLSLQEVRQHLANEVNKTR